MHGGGHVGWATSVCYSPTLRRVFSYGRMNTDLCVAGNEVTINWGGRDGPTMHIRAEVVDTPFVSRKRSQ
jgi:glycine cleavage system aminomethyltransferase T